MRQKTIIDSSTGEVLEQTVELTQRVSQDKFIQVYLEDLSGLLKLENVIQMQVLALIWKYCSYTNEMDQWNKIIILKDTKELWAQQLGCSIRNIERALMGLCNKDLITLTARATYILNPKYFFKGTSNMRKVTMSLYKEYFVTEE